jgi:hypothetical protein
MEQRIMVLGVNSCTGAAEMWDDPGSFACDPGIDCSLLHQPIDPSPDDCAELEDRA